MSFLYLKCLVFVKNIWLECQFLKFHKFFKPIYSYKQLIIICLLCVIIYAKKSFEIIKKSNYRNLLVTNNTTRMKKIKLICALLFLFSIKCTAQYFEGTITYKTTDKPETEFSLMYYDKPEIYTVKGDKVRLESSAQFFDSYYIYSNTKSGEVASCEIDTVQKYYEILISDYDKYDFETDKKYKRRKRKDENILGYNCKCYHYVYNTPSFTAHYDYWITDSIIPPINSFGLFFKGKGVVLKRHYKSPRRETTVEAVAISHKPINPELFEIPADCKARKSKIPAAMKKKYGVDKKSIPRDSLSNEKDSIYKINHGKWGNNNE